MRLCVAEDKAVLNLEPLTLTRPAFELRLGATTLVEKIARAFGVALDSPEFGVLVRPHLEALARLRSPLAAVNDRDWLSRRPTVVVNGRWVPPAGFQAPTVPSPWVGICDGQPACALVEPGRTADLGQNEVDAWFEDVAVRTTPVEVGGEWVRRPWGLVTRNSEYLVRDFEGAKRLSPRGRRLNGVAMIGPRDRLSIHESARIDPFTALDTTHGPITISAGVIVQPFTRIEGPCYIGPRTQLFRANVREGVTLGPDCRVGGEVEESLIHGHTNKYHEGFLGHAYVGEWVNLGAISSNSDLRNDYAEVHVPTGGGLVATGQAKVGCFIGDYTRVGMGSMLNTGTMVGVMCNLLPAGRLLPKYVPSFTAILYGRVAPNSPPERLFETARIVMDRRGRAFTTVEEQLLLDVYEQTRLDRERAFQRASEKREDRWPVSAISAGF